MAVGFMKESQLRTTVAGIGLWCTLAMPLLADVRLPRMLTDHMVLQQNAEVTLWGWTAAAGATVDIETSWGAKTRVRSNGNGEWRAKVKTPAARALDKGLHPETIAFTSGNKAELKEILIGEVWLCAGQSNMEMYAGWDPPLQPNIATICGDDSWNQGESAKADRPGLRLIDVANTQALTPQSDCRGGPDTPVWTRSTAASAGHFSATGYFFAAYLQEKLHVPVGMVSADWSGTPAESWTSLEALHALPDFAKVVPSMDPYIFPRTPAVLFNGMIAPLTPMTIRGVIWYQGESNMERPAQYATLFPALIQDWRHAFGKPDMPFYFAQIAPFTVHQPLGTLPAELRKAQEAALKLPHTGMAVNTDTTNVNEGHPRNKRAVGQRLALQALAKTYGFKDIVADGPYFKSLKVQGHALHVRFTGTGGGLVTRDGAPPTCFEIAGADDKFVPAKAEVVGEEALVSSSAVKSPVAVRVFLGGGGCFQPDEQKRPACYAVPGQIEQEDSLNSCSGVDCH